MQFLGLDRVFHDDQSLLNTERFFEKVVGAEFGGTHRSFNRAMARDHHHFGRIVQFANLGEGLETVHSGQPDVEQYDIEGTLAERLETRFSALDG